MNSNLMDERIYPKKKIFSSWRLGLITIVLACAGFVFLPKVIPILGAFFHLVPGGDLFVFVVFCGYFILSFIIGLYGLFRGIKEIKLLNKKDAIAGIISCLIGLILVGVSVFFTFAWMSILSLSR